jgi:hypothetical protein
VRIEICPPAALPPRARWSKRLLDWLGQGWDAANDAAQADTHAARRRLAALEPVRADFMACLGDVDTRQTAELTRRIGRARSLHELWHLRTEVFVLVSRQTDETEATTRLSRLNRHFTVRTSRSGFGGFDALPHNLPHTRERA